MAPLLVDLDEGVERGLDDVAREQLAFAQRLLRLPALGHVATDEEEALGRLGPVPSQDSHTSRPLLWMQRVSDDLRVLPAPRRAHLLAGLLEMVGMNEVDAAAADHLLRPVAQYGLAARADLHQKASGIHHHDQILRGLEDAAKLFGLLPQHLPGLVGVR